MGDKVLGNIESMSEQEIFDICAAHLLAQGEKSLINDKCVYRGVDGLKCAIGVLIEDKHYLPQYEDKDVNFLIDCFQLKVSCYKSRLLKRLQLVHDTTLPLEWPTYLKRIASEFELHSEVLSE